MILISKNMKSVDALLKKITQPTFAEYAKNLFQQSKRKMSKLRIKPTPTGSTTKIFVLFVNKNWI